MAKLNGSCHCGVIKFHIDTAPDERTICDCSLCTRRNAVMVKVPESALSVTDGASSLTLYEWNTRQAKHYFCNRCGIYVFHRKRVAPEYFGINVFCLDDFDASTLPLRATEGVSMTVTDPAARLEWPGPRRG